jgi:triacylglycerol esterase/lipase EstA (alpha/beta hydrolase family)
MACHARLEKTIKRLWLYLICLMATFTLGCGSDADFAQTLSDPTNQLPAHINWNSYNLYRFDPPTQSWEKIVSLGVTTGAVPALGDHPAVMVHGLGSNIKDGTLTPLAQDMLQQGDATVVFGFEYDTQDAITRNSTYFTQALQLLNPGETHPTWSMVGHSMGGLVIRSSVQGNVLPIAATNNKVVTIATPHFGSPVANAVQSANVFTQSVVTGVLNQGGFTNADGNPSAVNVNANGITDLRTDSVFLGTLNSAGNIDNHPQVSYYTLAGTSVGAYANANSLLGVTTDDGFVTVASANPPQLMATGTGTVAADHTSIQRDTRTLELIRTFLP